jgi:hypothetical protein
MTRRAAADRLNTSAAARFTTPSKGRSMTHQHARNRGRSGGATGSADSDRGSQGSPAGGVRPAHLASADRTRPGVVGVRLPADADGRGLHDGPDGGRRTGGAAPGRPGRPTPVRSLTVIPHRKPHRAVRFAPPGPAGDPNTRTYARSLAHCAVRFEWSNRTPNRTPTYPQRSHNVITAWLVDPALSYARKAVK